MIPYQIAKDIQSPATETLAVTGFPNYPSGRIQEGYRQGWGKSEIVDGVRTLRFPLYVDHSPSAAKRILSYLSFAVSSALGGRKAAKGADSVYVYATQLTAAFGPWLWRFLYGTPYVLHIQDLWPDSVLGSGMMPDGPAARIAEATINRWARSVYRHASAVIAIAPTMANTLAERGADTGKLHTLFNAGTPPVVDIARVKSAPGEPVNVLYAGNIGVMQDLDVAIDAIGLVGPQVATLTLLGDGTEVEELKRHVHECEYENIVFHPAVSGRKLEEFYARADFAFVPLRDLPVFRGTIPSKFQAALARGIPVLTSVAGDVTDIVTEHAVGYTARPGDADSLRDAVVRASEAKHEGLEDLRARATALYEARFHWDQLGSSIAAIMAKVSQVDEGERDE